MKLDPLSQMRLFDARRSAWARCLHQAIADGRLREDQIQGVAAALAHLDITNEIASELAALSGSHPQPANEADWIRYATQGDR